ncbi:MAG: HDOD domain-containing protein [Kineosporiaceae bacterium]|nr:HDOD domain-containing protein [Kineosporiaceae bacterium]
MMRLLRTANAASSGLRSEVTSLRQAIALLGPRPVAGLSESLSIARSLTLS